MGRVEPCSGVAMLYLISILAGVLGALGSWAVAAMIAASIGSGSDNLAAFLVIGPLAGVAGFITAVALTLTLKGDIRTFRGVALRSFGVVLMAGALAAGGYGLRIAALKHLGIMTKAPAVEFEIRLPRTATSADLKREAQVELLTDQNQTLARIHDSLRATDDGRAVLRGSVPLKFRTSDRMVVLSLPGQAQRAFKLRLPPDPSPSDDFGPWHLVDRVASTGTARGMPDDSFAIRYRVL